MPPSLFMNMLSNIQRYSVDIIDAIQALIDHREKESEFLCSVCQNVYLRVIEKEWDSITFNSDPTKYSFDVGIIWTCSKECRVTYILQKTL